ncbi:MAG: type II toxin-antitoxin system VapC family toxin [Rubrivivax sp.]|nr:type II toxin-antitoxin system VapC family toxin [Rubrivivax sp.]
MKLLLDTHIWLRWLSPGQAPLPDPVLAKIDAANELAVSAISCWELAHLARRGRIELRLPLEEWLAAALHGSGIGCIALDHKTALLAAELGDLHRDPADRFIIATALTTGRRLLTLDAVILTYPEISASLA